MKPVRPSVYKKKSAPKPAAAPGLSPSAALDTPAVPVPAGLIQIRENRGFTLWTHGTDLVAVPAASTSAARYRLPGRSFTLWTKPDAVQPVLMQNAPQAALSPVPVGSTEPVETSASAGPFKPVAREKSAPCCRPLTAAAAAALVLAGLTACLFASTLADKRQAETEAASARSAAAQAQSTADARTADLAGKEQALNARSAELQARLETLSTENAQLQQELTALRGQQQQNTGALTEKTAAAERLTGELNAARQEFSGKEDGYRTSAAALVEEAAQAKRQAAGQEVEFREIISRLEAEKAAARKEAATAKAELEALKAKSAAPAGPAPQ